MVVGHQVGDDRNPGILGVSGIGRIFTNKLPGSIVPHNEVVTTVLWSQQRWLKVRFDSVKKVIVLIPGAICAASIQ